MIEEMQNVRGMEVGDIAECAAVRDRSLTAMRTSMGLAPVVFGRAAETVGHLLATDPGGSTVVVDCSGSVVGFSQAILREDVWVLAHLFIEPDHQSAGTGRCLLAAATEYGETARQGIICSSPDPRAIRLYGRLPGFSLHPTFTASGTLRRPPRRPLMVREGGRSDHQLIDDLDRRLRGGAHGPDLLHLLAPDVRLLVCPERGYVLVGPAGPELLAAADDEAAGTLLEAALSLLPVGTEAHVYRFTGAAQWALPIILEAGLEVRPWGPLAVRGSPAASSAYLPSPTVC